MDHNANVRAVVSRGFSAIHVVADKCRPATIQYLIEQNLFEVNSTTTYGYTPLHLASGKNHLQTVTSLINLGADLDAKNHHGSTPLHNAAKYGHNDVIKLLMDKGANHKVVNNNNNTPAQVAEKNGNPGSAIFIRDYNNKLKVQTRLAVNEVMKLKQQVINLENEVKELKLELEKFKH